MKDPLNLFAILAAPL